ncbi:hypothetical protein HK099_003687 [Clydaea vesicula]|uniref:Uncharacterized protein n=1 Tax=Clydaea vesicula TaxID=447962 RepID=A0AAD5U323_9FUNG|nr:hypothetical protein HK099_003687 [Clydaea vesicula]
MISSFFKTSILYVGGVVAGVVSHVLETVLRGRKSIVDTTALNSLKQLFSSSQPATQIVENVFEKIATYNQPVYALMGSSAGAYSFLGAEIFILMKEIYFTHEHLKRSTYYNTSMRAKEKQRFFSLICSCFLKSASLIFQFYTLISPNFNKRTNFLDLNLSDQYTIGYSSHIGGFIFGFGIMKFFDYYS